jgi:transposase
MEKERKEKPASVTKGMFHDAVGLPLGDRTPHGEGKPLVQPHATGRPGYHPATLLKLYVYGYLNRVQSSRRLERECQRNIELIWLTGRLAPDFKTIADFRKDNGEAIRKVCREFVALCRRINLLSDASVAIDGSKFKAVNARDRNFTQTKMQRRLEQIDESIKRYLSQLDTRIARSPPCQRPRSRGSTRRLRPCARRSSV